MLRLARCKQRATDLAKAKRVQKWQRDPEGMRIRILEAAKQEFSAHGLAGARVDRIAANAGANVIAGAINTAGAGAGVTATATNSATLGSGAVKTLGDVAGVLAQYADTTMVVAGHTDSTGDDKSNQILSLKRAESVRDWMRDTGDVPESCFAVQGYGESRPVATNDTTEGRALNRRVEISLVPQANACQLPGNTPASSQDDDVSKNEME